MVSFVWILKNTAVAATRVQTFPYLVVSVAICSPKIICTCIIARKTSLHGTDGGTMLTLDMYFRIKHLTMSNV